MKVLSVVGARPQFIKAAPVSQALRKAGAEVLVHTGQHYDWEMSGQFFRELGIATPDYNLNVGSGSHAYQTGSMLMALEDILAKEQPDFVLVYGDTNSTLAGVLVAAKLHIPVAHVEAGLRSFNRAMPEEINRVVADHCSDILFCPTRTAIANLTREGIRQGVHLVGDVMYDALLTFSPPPDEASILERLGVQASEYVLATVHRASNTDDPGNLRTILQCLSVSDLPVIFPVHPRTAAAMKAFDLRLPEHVTVVEPVSYRDMIVLERNARAILTDSGGVQKEAFLLHVPCITLREETEWVETVEAGWNVIAGLDLEKVRAALIKPRPSGEPPAVFGNGAAAQQIAQILRESVH